MGAAGVLLPAFALVKGGQAIGKALEGPEFPPFPTGATPEELDESAARARENERKRRLRAGGRSSTILTGGLLSRPKIAVKKLTGE